MREAPRVFRPRANAPDVIALQLFISHGKNRGPWRGDPLPIGTAGEIRIETPIVVDHHHAVAGHADVELERVDADGKRALEAGQRVLGREPARAAMPLELHRRNLYSTFAPDSRINFSSIGASFLISPSNASGEAEGVGSMPWSAILSRTSGLASPFTAASCSRRTATDGVPAGT